MTGTTSPTLGVNHLGLNGIEFVEFASPDPTRLHALFLEFGFSRVMQHASLPIDLYAQHDIVFLLNRDPNSFAGRFAATHGPSIASMGWRVFDAKKALDTATGRGARAAESPDLSREGAKLEAIYGIGDSLIYLVDGDPLRSVAERYAPLGFVALESPDRVADRGFLVIDHMTNNVFKGTMAMWSDFYKNVFGFSEVRYFDIRGAKTGLTSFALRSPCGKFCIPINEADEKKSQINEYLDEYKGPGIQHLAFATRDILASLDSFKGSDAVSFLDIEEDYYRSVFERVPNVKEDKARIEAHNVLVDGDESGYLLQIFTKNIIGPIFIELIQREAHMGFGDGNFGALFRAIERDQMRRGVFDDKH